MQLVFSYLFTLFQSHLILTQQPLCGTVLLLNTELSTVCITFPAWTSRALLTKALTLEDSFGSKGFLQAAQVLVYTCSLLAPLCVAATPGAGKSWHLLGQRWFWCPEKWLWVCLAWRTARADVFISLLCAASSAVVLLLLLDYFQDLSARWQTQNRKKRSLAFASQLALEMNCKVTGNAKSCLAPIQCLFVFLEPVWLVSFATSKLYKLPLLRLNHQPQVPVTLFLCRVRMFGETMQNKSDMQEVVPPASVVCFCLFLAASAACACWTWWLLVAAFTLQWVGQSQCLTRSCCQPWGTWYRVIEAQLGFINEDWPGRGSIGGVTVAQCSLWNLSHQLSSGGKASS